MPAPTTYEMYAVYDEDEGLFDETLASSPTEAVKLIDEARDLREREVRMCLGKTSVRCVRVLVMGRPDDEAKLEQG